MNAAALNAGKVNGILTGFFDKKPVFVFEIEDNAWKLYPYEKEIFEMG